MLNSNFVAYSYCFRFVGSLEEQLLNRIPPEFAESSFATYINGEAQFPCADEFELPEVHYLTMKVS